VWTCGPMEHLWTVQASEKLHDPSPEGDSYNRDWLLAAFPDSCEAVL
jgi:hypothetical protein